MANGIIGIILPKNSFKLTSSISGAINIQGLGVSSVNIKLQSKVLRNVREDGVSIVHGRVITPTTIEVDVVIQTIDGIERLNDIMRDIEGTYDITSRGITIRNMRMSSEAIEQTPTMMSASPIRLSFKQALLQNDSQPICLQAADSSVLDAGITSINDAIESASEFANSMIERATSVLQGAI